MDISHSWLGVVDLVFDSSDTEAFTGDVSVSTDCFSVGFGICGLAFGPGCIHNGI